MRVILGIAGVVILAAWTAGLLAELFALVVLVCVGVMFLNATAINSARVYREPKAKRPNH